MPRLAFKTCITRFNISFLALGSCCAYCNTFAAVKPDAGAAAGAGVGGLRCCGGLRRVLRRFGVGDDRVEVCLEFGDARALHAQSQP